MNWEWLSHPDALRLTRTLAHFLWQGCAIALVLAVVLASGCVRSAARRYLVCVGALLLMLLAPVVTFFWLGNSSTPVPAVSPEAVNAAAVTGTMTRALPSHWLEVIGGMQPYVVFCWVTGMLLFGARLLLAFPAIARLRRDSVRLPAPLMQSMGYMNMQLGQNALGQVHASPQVSEATVVGLVRPMVLLPLAWLSRLPAGTLESVVAHELAHIRRFDLWTNLLQRVTETALFFHPAVWWLSRRATLEREMSCDDFAVALIGRRDEYALALEAVARQHFADTPTALGAAITGGNMNLLKRVHNVLGISASPGRDRWLPVGVMALSVPAMAWVTAVALLPAFATVASADGDRPANNRERPATARTPENAPTNPARREGQTPQTGSRDGERPRTAGPRDGEAPRTGSRDGQAVRTGPKDGEGVKTGPRDGQQPRTGPRDGDGVKKGPREVPGQARPGMRDGERPRTAGPRDGEGVRPGVRESQQPRTAVLREGERKLESKE